MADKLTVSAGSGSEFCLESAVTRGTERFSQTNLSDDVYDGIFSELTITGLDGSTIYAYAPPLPVIEEESGPVGRFFDRVSELFHWTTPAA